MAVSKFTVSPNFFGCYIVIMHDIILHQGFRCLATVTVKKKILNDIRKILFAYNFTTDLCMILKGLI